jgi:hypothetical protein
VTNFSPSWLTNEMVMYAAYAAFSLGLALKVIWFVRKPTVKNAKERV